MYNYVLQIRDSKHSDVFDNIQLLTLNFFQDSSRIYFALSVTFIFCLDIIHLYIHAAIPHNSMYAVFKMYIMGYL